MIRQWTIVLIAFLGFILKTHAQSPFLLKSTAPQLQNLYKEGRLELLLKVCRQEFLSQQDAVHDLAYWKVYRHLLYAYFTTENWDLAYLLADDLSKQTEIYGGKNSESEAIAFLIKGVVLNELGRVKEADPWYRNSYSLVQDYDFESDTELFILLHYADYLRQVGEYTASGRVFEQIMYSYDIELSNSAYESEIYMGRTLLALDLGLKENAVGWYQKLIHDDINLLKGERRINVQLLSARMALISSETDRFEALIDTLDYQLDELDWLKKERLRYQLLIKRYANLSDEVVHQPGDGGFLISEQTNASIAVAFYIEEGKANHHMGEYDAAIKTYRKALSFIKESYSPEHPYYQNVIKLMGLSAWAKGDIGKAATYLNRAAELNLIQYIKYFAFLSDQEKEAFYKSNLNFEDIYGSFVMDNYHDHPALVEKLMNHLMVFKGLLFNTNLTMRRLVFTHEALRDKFDQYLDIRSRIQVIREVARYSSISMTEVHYDSLLRASEKMERELSLRTFLINQEGISSSLVNSWSDLRAKIKPDNALVEIMKVGRYDPIQLNLKENEFQYLYLFLSHSSTRPQLYHLDGDYVERQSLAYKNAVKYKIQESKTYDVTWRPIVRAFDLSRYRNIHIVPDGIYNLVNLSSLYNERTERYLIEDYNFELLGNAADLVIRNSAVKQANQEILLVGYPLFGESELLNDDEGMAEADLSNKREATISLLPGTLQEVNNIENILSGTSAHVETLTHEQSNEFDFKRITSKWRSPQVIHMATHGFAGSQINAPSDDDPLEESGLMLSGAQWARHPQVLNSMIKSLNQEHVLDNGILSAREAMELHLMTTDLVVLSACETGLGKMNSGEGVYGLHRAFQTAGAKAVIMTLWKVDDDATKDFMISFYRQWSISGDIKASFRSAQLETKEKYHDPYYWAAFTLVGK